MVKAKRLWATTMTLSTGRVQVKSSGWRTRAGSMLSQAIV